jgi:hypothetical protein
MSSYIKVSVEHVRTKCYKLLEEIDTYRQSVVYLHRATSIEWELSGGVFGFWRKLFPLTRQQAIARLKKRQHKKGFPYPSSWPKKSDAFQREVAIAKNLLTALYFSKSPSMALSVEDAVVLQSIEGVTAEILKMQSAMTVTEDMK